VSDQLIPPQILHVDDDREILDNVREFLTKEDIPNWGRPELTSIESFGDALPLLETRRFDLTILDVRLGGHGEADSPSGEEEGVQTLEQIRNRRFLPVIFWTGLPGQVGYLASPLVHVREKSAGLNVLLQSVRDLFATQLPALNRALRHLIEDEQRGYMWDFVADHWSELREDGDPMALAYLLVRRLGRSLSGPGIQRLAVELGGAAAAAPALDKIHAAEMYIVPPFQDTAPGVGDLYSDAEVDGADRWWLVVTPSCDLERNKVEHVVLAACTPLDQDDRVRAWRENDSGGNRSKVRDLVSHKTGGQDDRNLFLPAAPTLPDLVVDFQRVRSVPRGQLDDMDRVASLASPFAEAAVNRFTRYFGRVGTDDLDVNAIMTRLKP
jgi:CheY-like chemotaxis protein